MYSWLSIIAMFNMIVIYTKNHFKCELIITTLLLIYSAQINYTLEKKDPSKMGLFLFLVAF